jgi:hypothetical protein
VSSRAALTEPATALPETGGGAAAWDGARRLQQTPRPTRRAGAVQRSHRRCAPAAHLSRLLPGEGANWSAGASLPWPPVFAPYPSCAHLSWPQHCRKPLAWRVALCGGTNCGRVYPGSVLDVEMTMLDKQSKGVPIDEQANDDVVHLDRFREADRLPDQAFDPCA